MVKYETAAIRITPAELTKEIMRSSTVQTAERLKTEQVEQRKKNSNITTIFPENVIKSACLEIEKNRKG